MAETRTIRVGALARVEGEGALHLVLEGDRVAELRLEIFEPPRLFEAFLRGRAGRELPDLMARICGICPVAYQMSAVHALEQIQLVDVHPQVRALRRLYYAGEWIESHLLHMVFLAAPDYLECDDATEIAKIAREPVEQSLRVRAVGNRILSLLGARPINPVGVTIGGFHRAPSRADMSSLREALPPAIDEACALFEWLATLPVPRRPQPLELVCLSHPDEYPMNEGLIVSSRGISTPASGFLDHFEERQVPHSTALHCHVRGRGPYQVGPLARVHAHREKLHPRAAAALASVASRFETPDPAASVFARAVEVIHALEEAAHIADTYSPPPPVSAVTSRAGIGHGATEAPRGLLYVRVETDAGGDVVAIRIVPPTSQNQAAIEDDLRHLAPRALARPTPQATRMLESAIRDYDPCISCSTHFLKLTVERREPPCPSP